MVPLVLLHRTFSILKKKKKKKLICVSLRCSLQMKYCYVTNATVHNDTKGVHFDVI